MYAPFLIMQWAIIRNGHTKPALWGKKHVCVVCTLKPQSSSFEEMLHVLLFHCSEFRSSHFSHIHLPRYDLQQKDTKNFKRSMCLHTLLFFDVELSHWRLGCLICLNSRRNQQCSLSCFVHYPIGLANIISLCKTTQRGHKIFWLIIFLNHIFQHLFSILRFIHKSSPNFIHICLVLNKNIYILDFIALNRSEATIKNPCSVFICWETKQDMFGMMCSYCL